MANLVVTSTTDHVEVAFNDYSSQVGYVRSVFRRSSVSEMDLTVDSVRVILDNRERWDLSTVGGNNTLIIDTVDGVAPSSLADLFDKLKILIKN